VARSVAGPVRRPPALAHDDFRSLWFAGLISDAGDWMLFVALPILVYSETGSALGTSLAFLIELAPRIVLAPAAGALADRLDRRRMLLVITTLQAVALLPLALGSGHGQLPVVYAVILAEASLSALFDPAKNALLPTLLPPAELISANALIAFNESAGRLVGGPLGGVLLAAGELRLIVVTDAVTYLIAALLIARVKLRLPARSPSPRDRTGDRTRHSATRPTAFLSAIRGREIRPGLVVAFTAQIAQGIFVVLFVLFVAQRLHGGAAEIGLMRGVQAIGALAAGLVLSLATTALSPARLTAWAAVLFGLLDLLVWNLPALSTATVIYLMLFIIVGAPGIALVTGLVSSLGLAAREHERGRVFSALGLADGAGQAIGMLAAGVLTPALGLMTMLDAQGVLYLAAGALAARWMVGAAVK
jgi:MFS family permease